MKLPLRSMSCPRYLPARFIAARYLEVATDPPPENAGRSKTYYAREAILAHLDDLEDLYLAEQRLMDIRAGKTETVPWMS